MAFDEGLAERIRELLGGRSDVSEKRMFGGIAFLVNGNMSVGVTKDALMVRVGPDAYAEVLDHPHTREMDFTGPPADGLRLRGRGRNLRRRASRHLGRPRRDLRLVAAAQVSRLSGAPQAAQR